MSFSIFFKGLVSFEIMSLKLIFFCPLMRLQFQLRGGGKGYLRVAFKVFKPEPGKRKSFYFAIQFKRASFSDCSISPSSCHQEHIEIRGLLIETYIFFSNQSLKRNARISRHEDHALQTSLPLQGFWPKNMI